MLIKKGLMELITIYLYDDRNVLTQVSSSSSTIFAKSGYVTEDEKNLILLNGNIQRFRR